MHALVTIRPFPSFPKKSPRGPDCGAQSEFIETTVDNEDETIGSVIMKVNKEPYLPVEVHPFNLPAWL